MLGMWSQQGDACHNQASPLFPPCSSRGCSQLHGCAFQVTRSLPPLSGWGSPALGDGCSQGEAVGVGGQEAGPCCAGSGSQGSLPLSGEGLVGACSGPRRDRLQDSSPAGPQGVHLPNMCPQTAPTRSRAPASLQAPPGSSSVLHWLKLDPPPLVSSPGVGRLSKKYSVFCK